MPINNNNIPRSTIRPSTIADTAPTTSTTATSATTATTNVSSRAELHGTHFAGSVEGARQRQGNASASAAGGASAEGFGLLSSLGRATGSSSQPLHWALRC